MRSPGFQRFVAIFVGILLVLDAAFAIPTGNETMIASVIALAGVYGIYLVVFFRKEKERRAKSGGKDRKKPESPLLRR